MHYDLALVIQGILGYGVIIMVALGFQLIFSTSRMFHFVYAGFYTLIIYMTYWAERLHLGLAAGVVVAVVSVLVVTALSELFIYRPMRRRRSSPLVILIASLGMLTALQSIIVLAFGSQPITLQTPQLLSGHMAIAGFQFSRIEFSQIVADVAVFAAVFAVLRWTGFGIQIRSVADDAAQARMVGVNVNRVILIVLMLGSLILIPVALLDGMNVGGDPYGGTTTLLIASIIAFVGGIGSMAGTMIVGLLSGVISGVSLLVIPSQWTVLVVFAVLVAAILVRPVGIMASAGGRRSV